MVVLVTTLHYEDGQAEIHKVVVGPMDNNVFVLRCKQTGDAVLLDAANEHDRLLDLCRALDVGQVLETHGHWDHIQAVPQLRDAGYDVARHRAGRVDAPVLRLDPRRRLRRSRSAGCGSTRSTRPATPRGRCASGSRAHRSCSAATPCSPAGRATPASRAATSTRSSARSRAGSSTSPADTIVLPGHGDDTTIGTERPHLQEWVDRGW